ncbi:hypothetical protein TWF569_001112 [Orbilia oligospora]|uniref:Uncharacterized protein n=2 Tax=Orbilia oligospora TaxID=2813651 RepID=G1X5P7_ARTOA|nr:hypothetical protein AOL_s00054g191 [Orbilia oligospora ATCC 24927]KAF3079619.1 hypothetical protein TWF706_003156 [Orbilia oligospora]EGX51492.1 hypothetical protein AOL_s00054g191 [Orbilia oligospora ATCC 24927]KAF3080905.1 hypothetical protein TWF102_002049 [Orbilia oligospora]KAF3103886.1 hypothetical protein TWF103_007040 [Orbilia oligospora]KAF3124966.1 hypothetical protein TWF569_001112 [Orbilia oligospora]
MPCSAFPSPVPIADAKFGTSYARLWGQHVRTERRMEIRAEIDRLYRSLASAPRRPEYTMPSILDKIHWVNGEYVPSGDSEQWWEKVNKRMVRLKRMGRALW